MDKRCSMSAAEQPEEKEMLASSALTIMLLK
jgi:hypothetical protein